MNNYKSQTKSKKEENIMVPLLVTFFSFGVFVGVLIAIVVILCNA